MWDKLKELFTGPKGPPVIIKPLAFEDGLLRFTAEKQLKLAKCKVAGPTKMGYMEVAIDVLSYDEAGDFYRGKITDEQFVLDAMQMNRRKEVRLDVKIGISSPEFPGKKLRTEDISLNGIRMLVPEPLKTGEYISLKLLFNDPAVPDMPLRGEVKWCAPTRKGLHHCGIRFSMIEKPQRAKISRFMKNRMAMGG